MVKMAKTFQRRELYELVWSEPMRDLAATFEMSDVGLAKICRKADIPVPPRGHWAKRAAGKRSLQTPLPPRFPGATDDVTVGTGAHRYGHNWSGPTLDEPAPPPPVFEEDMTSVESRAEAIVVGRVPRPPLSGNLHPLIKELLDKDEARKNNGHGWDRPEHDTPTERRRLRLLNALFLVFANIGCKVWMDTTQHPHQKDRSPSVTVGSIRIGVTVGPTAPTGRKRASVPGKEMFQLTIGSNDMDGRSWADADGKPIERQLREIVVQTLIFAEASYRTRADHLHDQQLRWRAEAEEKLRLEALERERLARELAEQEAKARIDRLLSQAQALDQSDTIRSYVARVRSRRSEILSSDADVEAWAAWALAEADRIDPVKNRTADSAIADLNGLRAGLDILDT